MRIDGSVGGESEIRSAGGAERRGGVRGRERNAAGGRIGFRESLRPELLERILVHLDGAREQRVVVAAGAAHAVEERVDLVDEGFEQRARVGFDERQHRAERGGGRAAMRGEPFLYPKAVTALIRDYLERARAGEAAPEDPLTPRELQVVKLIAEGYTSDEIAHELVIRRKTVDHHRANILDKLGLRNGAELTRYAIRRGLLEP